MKSWSWALHNLGSVSTSVMNSCNSYTAKSRWDIPWYNLNQVRCLSINSRENHTSPVQISRARETELNEEVMSLRQERKELQYSICQLEEDNNVLREEIQHLRGQFFSVQSLWRSLWSHCQPLSLYSKYQLKYGSYILNALFPRWHQWEPRHHDAGVSDASGSRTTADSEERLSGGGSAPSHSRETPTQGERGKEEIQVHLQYTVTFTTMMMSCGASWW